MRPTSSFTASLLAAALLVAPAAAHAETPDEVVVAVEAPESEERPEDAEQPAFPEQSEEGEEGSDKPIQFPLDLETPYGLFGMFLILSALAAVGLGLLNAVKNVRGERPKADGSWRPR